METKQLSRRLSDIECLCGFKSRKFTDVNTFFSFLCGLVLFGMLYLPLSCFRGKHWMVDMFCSYYGKSSLDANLVISSWKLRIILDSGYYWPF